MNIQQKQKFLEEKGIKVERVEGEDFSTVFHISNEDRQKIENNKSDYEKETNTFIMTSDNYGMSVVIMENNENED